jgi:hypothetical protein
MISAKQLTLVLMYLSVEAKLDSPNTVDNKHIKAIQDILGQEYIKELLRQISELDILVVPSVLQLPVLSTGKELANFCKTDDEIEEAFLNYQSKNKSLAVSPILDTSPSRRMKQKAKLTLCAALSQLIDAIIKTADDYYDLLRMLEEKTNVMIFPFLDVERHMEVSHFNLTLFRFFVFFFAFCSVIMSLSFVCFVLFFVRFL